MSSVELLTDRSTLSDISFRSMTEEQRQSAVQLPSMGSRIGAGGNTAVPALNLPASGPILSGQNPSGVHSIYQYNVYAPQSFEMNITQVRSEVLELLELEARAETVHRRALESVEQAAEHSLADVEQRAEHLHLHRYGPAHR